MSAPVPQVSVVIGAFNAAETLARSMDSVLSQEGVDLEVIVVNDGSRDATGAMLDEYARREPRVRVIHQENQGLTRALIHGCAAARGVYIARQDADDLSLPDRLRRQARYLDENPDVSFVCCGTRAMGPRGEPLFLVVRSPDPRTATRELREEKKGPPAHGSVMMRRDAYLAVGGYRAEFWFAQDSDLWLRLAERGLFACLPAEMYRYRFDAGSLSSKYRGIQLRYGELCHLCRKAREAGLSEQAFLEEGRTLASQRHGLARGGTTRGHVAGSLYILGTQVARSGQPGAWRYFLRAAALRPWWARVWFRLLQSLVVRRPNRRVN